MWVLALGFEALRPARNPAYGLLVLQEHSLWKALCFAMRCGAAFPSPRFSRHGRPQRMLMENSRRTRTPLGRQPAVHARGSRSYLRRSTATTRASSIATLSASLSPGLGIFLSGQIGSCGPGVFVALAVWCLNLRPLRVQSLWQHVCGSDRCVNSCSSTPGTLAHSQTRIANC